MAAHNYWRIYIAANNGDANYIDVNELELRATIGGADQCSGGTPLSSTTYPGFAVSNAFDNSVSTYCILEGTTGWVGYNFASAVLVEEIALTATYPGEGTRAPKYIYVEYSDDGSAWTFYWGIGPETGWGTQETRVFAYSAGVDPVINVTAQWVEEVHTSTDTPVANITFQFVEEIHSSTAAPLANITYQFVEEIHSSSEAPLVDITTQWVEYIASAVEPTIVHVSAQWVEYIAKRPTNAFVTNEYAEIISVPASVNIAVTQEYSEILSVPANPRIAVTQEYSEALSKRINWAFVTDGYAEVIAKVWDSIFPARVSDVYAETISYRGSETKAFTTSIYGEIITKLDLTRRVTNTYAETINAPINVNASTTSLFAEIIRKTKGESSSININSPI